MEGVAPESLIRATAKICGKEAGQPALTAALTAVGASIRGGGGMSAELEKYPGLFSPTMVALFGAGELDGTIDQMAARLATYLERAAALEKGA